MGLFLYDNLGGKTIIPKSNTLDISKKLPNILKKKYKTGFQYFDVQIDDKKLTKLNIKSAKKYKAKVLEYNKVKKAEIDGNEWVIHLQKGEKIKSKILINASGPWINETLKKNIKIKSKNKIRLVKGSHIITKKLYKKDVAFTFQNTDKRIIFVIPYKKKFSLIGTTEVEVKSPENKGISKKEIQYLIRSVNNYLEKQISTKDIVDSYSGIRPLIEDFNQASKVTRDYIFDLNIIKKLPLLSIYGGKLTTYRKLAGKCSIRPRKVFA
jgi:glycerol-3-phosphate dehydrogenase